MLGLSKIVIVVEISMHILLHPPHQRLARNHPHQVRKISFEERLDSLVPIDPETTVDTSLIDPV